MGKSKVLKVKDLRNMLDLFVKEGLATEDSEVWLSSDEEGNSESPLIQLPTGTFNVGTDKNKSKLLLYPSSLHTTY